MMKKLCPKTIKTNQERSLIKKFDQEENYYYIYFYLQKSLCPAGFKPSPPAPSPANPVRKTLELNFEKTYFWCGNFCNLRIWI